MSDRFQLLARVRAVAAADPDRPAYIDAKSGERLTYAEFALSVDALRGELPSNARVLLQCGTRFEFPIWFLALIANGNEVCPVHPELTPIEVEQLTDRIEAGAVIGSVAGSRVRSWPVEYARKSPPAEVVSFSPCDTPGTLLLTSSGTTGIPKIVCRSERSLDAVSDAMVRAIGFTAADQVLACVPLSHSYGLEHGLLAPLWAGSTVHLCEGIDLPVMTRALSDYVTIFPAVPAMIEMLATLTDAPAAMPRLRVAYSAGGPLSSAINAKFAERFGRAVGQVYGMTEIGSVTFNDPAAAEFIPNSVGRPMAGVSIRLLPSEDATEIAIAAESMFDGYLGEPAALVDGYFPTGDLGHVDAAGNLIITGRARLLIDTGGMKVNPLEVEAVLSRHPDVSDCVVVAIKQSDTIQRLRAFVVPRNLALPPTSEVIRQFARSQLASYKVPRVIEFRTTLPRSPAGKILRRQLEAEPCDL